MKLIIENIKVHFYLLKNSSKTCGLLLFGFSFIIFMFFFFASLGMSVFYLLSFLAKINYVFSVILLISSYLLFTASRRYQQDEVIEAMSLHPYAFQKYTYFVIMSFVLVLNIILVLGMLIISLQNHDAYFVGHFFQPYAYNILIPHMICVTFAFVLSLFKNQVISFLEMFIFAVMVGPLSEFVWAVKPDFSIDKVYAILKRPFEIFYQNSEWAIDPMYGLQTEKTRLWIMITWLLVLLLIYIIKAQRQSRQVSKRRLWISCGLAIVTVISVVGMYIPESRFRLNDAWDGYRFDFVNTPEQDKRLSEPVIDYKISQYDLTVSTSRQLHVSGLLTVEAAVPQQEIVLTLYQNYDISKLSGKDIESYRRDRDYVYIRFRQPIQHTKIEMVYQGSHPRFYANSQATMLPGYFPWYPMSGQHQVFLNVNVISDGNSSLLYKFYNVNNHVEEAEMIVRADRYYTTNLKADDDYVYRGRSDSISLFSGYLEDVNLNNVRSYLPFIDGIRNKTDFLDQQQRSYLNELDLIEAQFGVPMDAYRHKRLLFVSEDLGRNTTINGSADFDDYMIFDVNLIHGYIVFQTMMKHATKNTMLVYQLMRLRLGETAEETYQNLVRGFEDFDDKGYIKQLEKAKDKIGVEALLKEIYAYVYDETIKTDQEFLERINGL